jgi:hypothetical protein
MGCSNLHGSSPVHAASYMPDENMEIDSRTLTPAASSPAPLEDTLPAPFSGPLTRARAHELNYVLLLKNEGPEA